MPKLSVNEAVLLLALLPSWRGWGTRSSFTFFTSNYKEDLLPWSYVFRREVLSYFYRLCKGRIFFGEIDEIHRKLTQQNASHARGWNWAHPEYQSERILFFWDLLWRWFCEFQNKWVLKSSLRNSSGAHSNLKSINHQITFINILFWATIHNLRWLINKCFGIRTSISETLDDNFRHVKVWREQNNFLAYCCNNLWVQWCHVSIRNFNEICFTEA